MKKTIILSEKQINEVLGANASYLDSEKNGDFNEFHGSKVSAETNSYKKPGKPVTTDKISGELATKDGFWRMRGARAGDLRGGIGSLTCSKESKKKILESNSELEGTKYQLDPTTIESLLEIFLASDSPMDAPGRQRLGKILTDGEIEYTNMTTIKSEMDNMDHNSSEFIEMGGEPLYKFIERNLNLATTNVSDDKARRAARGEENVYQKAGGTKNSGNGKQHKGNTNIIMK